MLTAPFPYFGGKRRVASIVWDRFGDVQSYNEPFFGSGAVLLGRPHDANIETVNDIDCMLANFWRAVQHDPEQVAFYADSPVNEADMHSRHRWLVLSMMPRVRALLEDPHYFNAKAAGWWVWGQCLWIGSGWCQAAPEDYAGVGDFAHHGVPSQANTAGYQRGVHTPSLMDFSSADFDETPALRRWQGGGQGGGSGVHAPSLWKQPPDLSGSRGAAGRGTHGMRFRGERPWEQRKKPHLTNASTDGYARTPGRGMFAAHVQAVGLYEYFRLLSARLRRVRVCCGDWQRVLSPSVTSYIGTCGIFLDPPYDHNLRERCYSEDHNISAAVRTWALEHGDEPNLRIALCGYQDEHGPHMPASWECVPWRAHGGYSRSERGKENRTRERIWFSPNCLRVGLPFD